MRVTYERVGVTVVFLFCVLAMSDAIFQLVAVWRQGLPPSPSTERPWYAAGMVWAVGVVVVSTLAVFSYAAAVAMDGGRVPPAFDVGDPDALRLALLSCGRANECATCGVYKPSRTHHCTHCGRCVLRYDHHCAWIGRCVGFENYRAFVALCVWGTIATTALGLSVAADAGRALLRLGGVNPAAAAAATEASAVGAAFAVASHLPWSLAPRVGTSHAKFRLAEAVVLSIAQTMLLVQLRRHVKLAAANATTVETFLWPNAPTSPFSLGSAWENAAAMIGASTEGCGVPERWKWRWLLPPPPTEWFGKPRRTKNIEEGFDVGYGAVERLPLGTAFAFQAPKD